MSVLLNSSSEEPHQRNIAWAKQRGARTSTRQSHDLAADDVLLHLIDLRGDFRRCLADHEIRGVRAGLEAVWQEARLPGTGQELLDLILDHVALPVDGKGSLDRFAPEAAVAPPAHGAPF